MKIRRQIRLLHRWIGLLASLWILQLAMTGLLLQQADKLSLHDRYVESAWILQWFGYGQEMKAFSHRGEQIYQVDDQVLVNNQRQRIPQSIRFAAKMDKLWVVATAQSLYGLNSQNEILWRLDDFDGLPTPVTNLHADEKLMVAQNGQWYTVDSQLQIKKNSIPPANIHQAKSLDLTNTKRRQVVPQAFNKVLSYDKVLADIHAGYKSSVWLNTLSALALLYLSLSGIYLFFRPRRQDRKTRQ